MLTIKMSKGSGGLMQLVTQRASGNYLSGNTGDPYCYNIRDSMTQWSIERDDGQAHIRDIV